MTLCLVLRNITTNTNAAEETSDCEISSSRSGGSGNVSSDDRFFPSTKREDVQPTSQDDAADEVSRQPATSGGSSQSKRPGTAVIKAPHIY
jgi:hypothetical protein